MHTQHSTSVRMLAVWQWQVSNTQPFGREPSTLPLNHSDPNRTSYTYHLFAHWNCVQIKHKHSNLGNIIHFAHPRQFNRTAYSLYQITYSSYHFSKVFYTKFTRSNM